MVSCFMYAGDKLIRGDQLVALNGDYKLVHQYDGNVVLYDKTQKPHWSTDTAGKQTTHFAMEHDGNMALFNHHDKIWSIGKEGSGGWVMLVQDNNECGVSDKDDRFIYSFGKGLDINSPDFDHSKIPLGGILPQTGNIFNVGRNCTLLVTTDGDLSITLTHHGEPKKMGFSGGKYLAVQYDGNVVFYDDSWKPVHDFRTTGSGAQAAMILDNGKFVLVDDVNATQENAEQHTIKVLVDGNKL